MSNCENITPTACLNGGSLCPVVRYHLFVTSVPSLVHSEQLKREDLVHLDYSVDCAADIPSNFHGTK